MIKATFRFHYQMMEETGYSETLVHMQESTLHRVLYELNLKI